MTLNTVSTAGLPDLTATSLGNALGELQRLKVSVATGAGASTNIAVAGIVTTDTLISVIEVPAATTTLVDRTSTTTITSSGNIQCSASTSGNQVLVYWFDKA